MKYDSVQSEWYRAKCAEKKYMQKAELAEICAISFSFAYAIKPENKVAKVEGNVPKLHTFYFPLLNLDF